jgi:AcrR family transcriptional regulator
MAATSEPMADDSTRNRILEAALQCFKQLGIDKTSLIDVARTADLSRGTVYRYFSDRQSLIDATVERNVENYYGEATDVMSDERTLVDQIGAFAEVFARNINNYRRNWLVNDDRELLRLLVSDRDGGCGACRRSSCPTSRRRRRGARSLRISTPPTPASGSRACSCRSP